MCISAVISRSIQLYKQNFKPLLVLGVLCAAISVLTQSTAWLTRREEVTLIINLVGFIFCPILGYGLYRYLLKVWRNESSHLSELLHYCRSLQDYGRVLWFAFCFGCCSFIVIFAVLLIYLLCILLSGPANLFNPLNQIVLLAIFVIPIIWFTLRVFLVNYLFLFQEWKSPWQTIKEGFMRMKGNMGRLFLLQVVVVLLSLCFSVPGFLVTQNYFPIDASQKLLLLLLSFVAECIIAPLTWMLQAGFASEILQDCIWEEDVKTPLSAATAGDNLG